MASQNPMENPIPCVQGDPDDHEVGNALLWPEKLGCLVWGVSAGLIVGGGAKLIGVGTESFDLARQWPEVGGVLATALLAWPAVSAYWAIRSDLNYFPHHGD